MPLGPEDRAIFRDAADEVRGFLRRNFSFAEELPAWNPRMNRKDLLKAGAAGALIAAGLGIALNNSPRNEQKMKQAKELQQEGERAIEANDSLQTKYFAGQILAAGARMVPLGPQFDNYELLVGAFVGTTLGESLFHFNPPLFNRLVGVGTGFTARVLDEISTFIAASALSDPRTKEYGLDAYIYEDNTQLPADLTPQALLESELPSTAELAGICFLFPLVGKMYLGAVPFVFKNNIDAALLIVNFLNLGDKVKAMIKEGKKGDEILAYLNGVGKNESKTIPNNDTRQERTTNLINPRQS